MPGEILHLHIGQVGVESAGPCWEQLAAQHDVAVDGGTVTLQAPSEATAASCDRSRVFAEASSGRWVPRAVLIDTDPWLPGVVKRGACSTLFAPASVVAGKRDAGNCWAAGRYTAGYDCWKDTAHDVVRRQVEACDTLDAVLVYHSVCGGTGSGLTDQVLEDIGKLAPKAHRITQSTIPSPNLPASNLEHYNAVLGIGTALLKQAHVASCVQTEALRALCQSMHGGPVSTPVINGVSAATMNMLHLPLRAASSLRLGRSCFDLRDFLNGQGSPAPSPLVAPGIAWGAVESTGDFSSSEVVATRATSPAGSLVVPAETSSQAGAAVRGKDKDAEAGNATPKAAPECVAWSFAGSVEPRSASAALEASAARIHRGAATRFGAVAMVQGPAAVPRAPPSASPPDVCVATIAKTPALGAALRCNLNRFQSVFSTRAYAHWFVSEGMEEGEFYEAVEAVLQATRELERGDGDDDDSVE